MTAMELEKPAAIHHSPEQSAREAAERIMAAICGDGVWVPPEYTHMPGTAMEFETAGLINEGMRPKDVIAGIALALERYSRSTSCKPQGYVMAGGY